MNETRSTNPTPTRALVTALAICLVSACFQLPSEPAGEEVAFARANIYDAMQAKLGSATFTNKGDNKVEVSVSLRNIPDGEHGMHIHVEGLCEGPEFKSAEGHWNPSMHMHGAPGGGEHHDGDLGNIIAEGGVGKIKLTLSDVNMIVGDEFSVLGHAVILHEQGDDYMTQMPPGNAGARIGCGIIEPADPGQNMDPPPVQPNQTVNVAGKVSEIGAHFAGGAPSLVKGVALSTLGLNPEQTTLTSNDEDTAGTFTLKLPQNGKTIIHATKQGYLATYSEVTTTANNISGKRLFAASSEYITSIAATYNINMETPFACHAPPEGGLSADQQCVYGIIMGQIIDDGTAGNGVPTAVSGIQKTDFRILGQDDATWYTKGPYFLTSTGAPSREQLRSSRNGLFISFVELPATEGAVSRDFKVSIEYSGANGKRYFGPTNIKAYRPYGVTWTFIRETGQPAPMPMPMEPEGPGEPVDFDGQIYPLFLSVAQGGYGCVGCHTTAEGTQPAAGFNLFGGPTDAYASLNPMMYPERVNLAMPSMSLLLSKPLYEDTGTQNHPIVAFTTKNDEAYKLIQNWIKQGALRGAPVATVSFTNDIVPLLASPSLEGGAGCVTCHGVEPAPGNFYVGGGPDLIYAELTTEIPADDGATGELLRINKLEPAKSLLLTNALVGSGEPHPVKLFGSNADSRYSMLYRWIVEGAEKN